MRPAIRIEDCGEKMGLNGVDNGRIWFDQVRVPRDALLNRYGERQPPTGVYSSPIENPEQRFFTMLGNARPGARVHLRGVDQRRQVRADDRGPLRAAADASSDRRASTRSRSSTTARSSAG